MGVQNKPLQDMSLWYGDCFELKAILAPDSRENSDTPYLNYLEEPELGALPITGNYQQ